MFKTTNNARGAKRPMHDIHCGRCGKLMRTDAHISASLCRSCKRKTASVAEDAPEVALAVCAVCQQPLDTHWRCGGQQWHRRHGCGCLGHDIRREGAYCALCARDQAKGVG